MQNEAVDYRSKQLVGRPPYCTCVRTLQYTPAVVPTASASVPDAVADVIRDRISPLHSMSMHMHMHMHLDKTRRDAT